MQSLNNYCIILVELSALIVHNVQGVVLSFDFSCVSVFVDVLCFHHIQSCLVNSTYDIATFPGVFYFYFRLGQISLLSILITCTQL